MSRRAWVIAIFAAIAAGEVFTFARLRSEGHFAMPPKDPFIFPEQKLQDQPLGAPQAPPNSDGD
jgi:hypothetical protein